MNTILMITLATAAVLLGGCGPKEEDVRASMRLREELAAAEKRIEGLEQQISRAQQIERKSDALVLSLEAANRKLSSEAISLQSQLDLANSKMQTMRQLGRAEAQLEALTGSSGIRTNYVPAARPVVTQPDPEPPAWRYPPEYEARKIIRTAAEEKWGENYRMVEYEIERQTTAHQTLHRYEKKRWSNPVIRRALNAAGNKWGMNFSMVIYELEQQLEAKDRLDATR